MAHSLSLSPVHTSNIQRELSNEPSKPPKTEETRLSCDSCLAAKVKCAKQRPTCVRCLDRDITCVYSRSRRVGKPTKTSAKTSGTASRNPSNQASRTGSRQQSAAGAAGSMDWEGTLRKADTSNTTHPFHPNKEPVLSHLGSMNLFDYDFQLQPNGSVNAHEVFDGSVPNIFNTDLNQPAHWSTTDMDAAAATTRPACPSTSDLTSLNVVPGADINSTTPTTGTLNDTGFSSKIGRSSPSCGCRSALQATLVGLKTPLLRFDQFITTSRSAVDCMTCCLSCNCTMDILDFMLLSLNITLLVHCCRQISKGESRASTVIGMTAGSVKFDSKDEFEIRQTLLHSELQKIRRHISDFHDRFRSNTNLDEAERYLYQANLEFLRDGVDRTVTELFGR